MSAAHFALISPYDAGNLGDAAILESVSGALRSLVPGCRMTAVTLAPAAMPDYHGMPGWPITGASIEFYAINPAVSTAAPAGQEGSAVQNTIAEVTAPRRKGNSLLGRVPGLGPVLRKSRWLLRFVIADLRHWRASHAWLADVDCVMVAGGGQFDDEWGGAWGHPYALFKWSVLARLRRIPFVVASVGVCRTQDSRARDFFARTMRNSGWLSFRDAQSREIALAMEPRRPGQLVSDLAFGLDAGTGSAGSAAAPLDRPLRIGVSPIAYRMPGAWPIEDRARFEEYMKVLLELVCSLRAAGYEVVLFTSERTDRDVVKLVREHFAAQGEPPLDCSLPDRLGELLRTLNGLDAIVTSRLHGIILAHVLGKPAAALSYDRKVRAHMTDMSQDAYCVDIDSPDLANAPAIVQKLIAERADAAARVRAALSVRKAQVMHQYAQLANIALTGSRGR